MPVGALQSHTGFHGFANERDARLGEVEGAIREVVGVRICSAFGKYYFSHKADPPSHDFWVRSAEGENKMAALILVVL
jgi:hypothetical protein